MLHDLLGEDKMAPIYVMRLWGHCQSRKSTHFTIPTLGIKALCRYAGDAAALESALIDSGFIVRNGASIEILGWAEQNAKLIANWKNGSTGGRPSKTQEEPKDNPNETQPEPTETHVEPIRVDKSGLDKNGETSKAKTSAAPKRRATSKTPLPADFSISDRVRKWAEEKGYARLEAHFEGFVSKCRAKGYTYADWDEGLMGAIREDWAKLNVPQARASPAYQSTQDKAREWADKATGRANGQRDFIDINEIPSGHVD
jgi:hypothetical protein